MSVNLLNFSCLKNVSGDSITEIAWTTDNPEESGFSNPRDVGFATSVIVSLIFLTGVPWNFFVIFVIVKKKLYSNPTIMLLLNLTIANFLLGLIVMPFSIITGFSGEYLFGNSDAVRCHVCQSGLLLTLLSFVTLHTIALMSVDRFIYLKSPLTYNLWITPKRIFIAIITVWILCTVISLPPLLGFGEMKFSFTVATCTPYLVGRTHVAPNYYYVISGMAEAFIPITFLIVMNTWILYITRKSILDRLNKSKTSEVQKKDNMANEKRNFQLRLVRVFAIIFLANLLTWLPVIALGLTGAIVGAGQIPIFMYSFAFISYLSETVIHPILEACFIREVRVTMSNSLRYCQMKIQWCRDKGPATPAPSATFFRTTQRASERSIAFNCA